MATSGDFYMATDTQPGDFVDAVKLQVAKLSDRMPVALSRTRPSAKTRLGEALL